MVGFHAAAYHNRSPRVPCSREETHGRTLKLAYQGDRDASRAVPVPPQIAADLDSTVVLTTDKSREALEQVAGGLPVILAPEGCCVYRRPGEPEWVHIVEDSEVEGRDEWMEGVKVVFDYFRERTPGSYVEKQEYQYRWCWDTAQFDFGSAQAREVLIHLWAGPLVNSEAEVVVGDRSITVRPHACSRSACLLRLLHSELGEDELEKVDFALCFAVASHRDQDVFETLQNLLEDEPELESQGPPSRSDGGSDCPPVSARSSDSPSRVPAGEPLLHTPPGPAPTVQPGELPPPYDWVPTAQREREQRPGFKEGVASVSKPSPLALLPPTGEAPAPILRLPTAVGSAADSEDRAGYCACYTLSLGMKKTKAQNALPHPYHVQNLLRAMAHRLPQRSACAAVR